MERACRVPFRAPDRSLEVIVALDRSRVELVANLAELAEPVRRQRLERLAELARTVSGQLAEVRLAEPRRDRLELSLSLEHLNRFGRDRAADLLAAFAAELVHGDAA